MAPGPHAMAATASAGQSIYLDHAAATPLDGAVAEAMQRAAADAFGNPSSPHAAGRRARAALEEARERLIALLGGHSTGPHRDRLVFTSGATEANRLGMLGTAGPRAGAVGTSPRDHGSIVAAAEELAARGWRHHRLLLAAGGSASAAAAALAAAESSSVLVSATLVCGQTGIRESLGPLEAADVGGGVFVHADATQAVAFEPLSFAALPVTSLTLAAHKFGGPRGIGGLLVRGSVEVRPLVPGPQELGLRGGTEAVVLAVGFAAALDRVATDRDQERRRLTALRDLFEARFEAAARRHGFEPLVVGGTADRAAHISTIAVRGCERQSLVMACDLAGICLATGTACASGSSDPAPGLVALDLPDWVPGAAIRASFGAATTSAEIDEAGRRLEAVFHRLATAGLLQTWEGG